jgi:hypothetical protein
MLVTFREHAAPDLCIFHRSVTIKGLRRVAVGCGVRSLVSYLFTIHYE